MEKKTAVFLSAIGFIFRAFLPTKNTSSTPSAYRKFGSTGVGCTVDKPVSVTVASAKKYGVHFNGKRTEIPTITTALKQLTDKPLSIHIESELPLGCGFGISGASVLAALNAANNLLKLKVNTTRLTEIAHFAEIREKTGLGTVATQITGGFILKTKPGIPPEFERYDFRGKKIYAVILGKLPTPGILSDGPLISNINAAADRALLEIRNEKNPGLDRIIDISYNFCRESGLLPKNQAEKLIESIRSRGGHASMAIVGNVVLSTIKPEKIRFKTAELKML